MVEDAVSSLEDDEHLNAGSTTFPNFDFATLTKHLDNAQDTDRTLRWMELLNAMPPSCRESQVASEALAL